MKISEAIPILKTQKLLKRTVCGRPINEYALEVLDASISDVKNHGSEVTKCLNCCIIISELLVPKGCPNCNGHDLSKNIDRITKGE